MVMIRVSRTTCKSCNMGSGAHHSSLPSSVQSASSVEVTQESTAKHSCSPGALMVSCLRMVCACSNEKLQELGASSPDCCCSIGVDSRAGEHSCSTKLLCWHAVYTMHAEMQKLGASKSPWVSLLGCRQHIAATAGPAQRCNPAACLLKLAAV